MQQAMPIFIRKALMNEDIILEGTGEQSRDLNYVTNMVHAIELALSKPEAVGEVFHIGSGEETYFNRLLVAIPHFLKSNSKIVNKPWREGEVGKWYARC
jgi:UDP-glucose 4-epimerase